MGHVVILVLCDTNESLKATCLNVEERFCTLIWVARGGIGNVFIFFTPTNSRSQKYSTIIQQFTTPFFRPFKVNTHLVMATGSHRLKEHILCIPLDIPNEPFQLKKDNMLFLGKKHNLFSWFLRGHTQSCFGFQAEEPCIKLNECSAGFIWQNKQTWKKKKTKPFTAIPQRQAFTCFPYFVGGTLRQTKFRIKRM